MCLAGRNERVNKFGYPIKSDYDTDFDRFHTMASEILFGLLSRCKDLNIEFNPSRQRILLLRLDQLILSKKKSARKAGL